MNNSQQPTDVTPQPLLLAALARSYATTAHQAHHTGFYKCVQKHFSNNHPLRPLPPQTQTLSEMASRNQRGNQSGTTEQECMPHWRRKTTSLLVSKPGWQPQIAQLSSRPCCSTTDHFLVKRQAPMNSSNMKMNRSYNTSPQPMRGYRLAPIDARHSMQHVQKHIDSLPTYQPNLYETLQDHCPACSTAPYQQQAVHCLPSGKVGLHAACRERQSKCKPVSDVVLQASLACCAYTCHKPCMKHCKTTALLAAQHLTSKQLPPSSVKWMHAACNSRKAAAHHTHPHPHPCNPPLLPATISFNEDM